MKNAKKIFGILIAIIALALVMSISIFAQEYEVADSSALTNAYNNAQDGDTIKLTADITVGTVFYLEKPVTLDLNGKTLTATDACKWGAIRMKNGSSLINGTVVHQGLTCAIKMWNADKIENVTIECTYAGGDETVGGIVFQKDAGVHVNSIKNVEIKGVGLTNGIETYCCGNATNNVVDLIENVKIDANGVGIWVYAPVGVVKNSTIHGDVSGISTQKHATDAPDTTGWRTTITLQDCDISGNTQAILVDDNGYAGTTNISTDSATTLTSDGRKITVNVTNANNFTARIAGFIQNGNGEFVECTEHDYVETSRVQPVSTTVPGKVVFTCSDCSATDEKDIKLYEVTASNFTAAYNSADEYDIIRFTANAEIAQVTLSKPIVVDLNGFTLTTTNGYSGVNIGGGASFINGTLLHKGNTCAIKAYNANRIEDLIIKVESAKTDTGGISTRNATDAKGNGHINVLKNVTMIGTGNYGIETYQAASSTEPVIDLIENVKIDSMKYGIDLRFPLGTIKDSVISGSQSGIAVSGSGITVTLVGENEIMGGDNALTVSSGSVILKADKYTNFINTNGGDVFSMSETSASISTFNLVGYTVEGNTFTECDHESTGGSCTVRAECTKCTKVLGYVHSYVENVEQRIPSDCTVQGTAFLYCDCGASKEEFIARDPNAHVWLTEETLATCTTEGGMSYNCKYGSCTGEEWVDVYPALGHAIVLDEAAVAPTCTETGLTSAEHCTRDGCTYATTQQTVDELGHDIIIDAAVPSTCTQTGLAEGKHCSRCDAETVLQATVPALGHDMKTKAAVAPTCINTGLTEGKYCSRCDDMTVTQTIVPVLGHDIITTGEAVVPTCTETGLTKGEKCSRCAKATVEQKVVPALGHTWLEATLEAPKTCSVCATTEGEKLTPPDEGMSGGAIAGIVAGAVAVLGGGGFALYWFVFRRRFI